MNAPRKSRARRIRALETENGVVDDEVVRRLVKRGVLVPLTSAPRRPIDPVAKARLFAAMAENERRRRDDDQFDDDPPEPGPTRDHRGRTPDHFEYMSDD
jgi:hypothetical protein